MKIRILPVVVLVLAFFSKTYGQLSLQVSPIIPAGDYYTYLLKPGASVELGFKQKYDRFLLGGALGYYSLAATQDTFAVYAVSSNGNIIPGTEELNEYRVLSFVISGDFKILTTKLTPIVGLDFGANYIEISANYAYESLVSYTQTGGDSYFNWTLTPRIGAWYEYQDKWGFAAGFGRVICFGGTYGSQAFWKPYISATYYFDKN